LFTSSRSSRCTSAFAKETMPSRILMELLAQHAALRQLIDRCEQQARRLDDDRDPAVMARELARLRVAFDAHNDYEESVLEELLGQADAFGEVRHERMVLDHLGEHRLLRSQLEHGLDGELRLALDRLRGHLAAEERMFLSPRVLRDDLVVLEAGA
jgi:hypothetical protein